MLAFVVYEHAVEVQAFHPSMYGMEHEALSCCRLLAGWMVIISHLRHQEKAMLEDAPSGSYLR